MEKRYKKNVICLNCNNVGHIQKNCKYPINSYGIILFKVDNDNDNNIKFLMIQRKYSYAYLSLLQAKYLYNIDNDDINKEQLLHLISLLPLNERYLIKRYSFKYLWNKIWIWKSNNTCKNIDILENKFNELKKNYIHLIMEHNLDNVLLEPEWEFPKGKRMKDESNLQCALRECEEETGIYIYKVYDKIYYEKFIGSNGLAYCNNYYLSEYNSYDENFFMYNLYSHNNDNNDNNDNIYYNPYKDDQCAEIRKIGWFTLEQILQKISHQDHKIKLINNIYRILKTNINEKNNLLKYNIKYLYNIKKEFLHR